MAESKSLRIVFAALAWLIFTLGGCDMPQMKDFEIPSPNSGLAGQILVVFNSTGGTHIGPQELRPGDTAQRPADPARGTAVFVNWFTSTEDTAAPYDFSAPVTKNLTLFAKWSGGEVWDEVSYAAAFVTYHEKVPTPDPLVVKEGRRITRPSSPVINETLKGSKGSDISDFSWIFAGWYTDDTYKTAWDFESDVVQGNTVLYAGWKETMNGAVSKGPGYIWPALRQAVIFNSLSELSPSPKSQITNAGQTLTQPGLLKKNGQAVSADDLSSGAAREGYRFLGWFYTDGQGGQVKWNFDTPVNDTLVLNAGWEPLYFNIEFHTMGGSLIPVKRLENREKLQKPADPLWEDHLFLGWHDKALPGDSVRKYDTWPMEIAEDTVLYAHWEFDYFNYYNKLDFPDIPVENYGQDINRHIVGTHGTLQHILDNRVKDNVGIHVIEVPKDTVIGQRPFTVVPEQIISLRGAGETSRIWPAEQGALYTVEAEFIDIGDYNYIRSNGKLILRDIVLEGHANNNNALVALGTDNGYQGGDGGELFMENGVQIINNVHKGSDRWNAYGGGVSVLNGGYFEMNGGIIAHNTMYGRYQLSNPGEPDDFGAFGGGVGIRDATFTMNGGQIYNNLVTGTIQNYGGGVGGYGGTDIVFTMTGGVIRSNHVTYIKHETEAGAAYGGGIGFRARSSVNNYPVFIKTGGIVFGSDAGTYLNMQGKNTVAPSGEDGDTSNIAEGSAWWINGNIRENTAGESFQFDNR